MTKPLWLHFLTWLQLGNRNRIQGVFLMCPDFKPPKKQKNEDNKNTINFTACNIPDAEL